MVASVAAHGHGRAVRVAADDTSSTVGGGSWSAGAHIGSTSNGCSDPAVVVARESSGGISAVISGAASLLARAGLGGTGSASTLGSMRIECWWGGAGAGSTLAVKVSSVAAWGIVPVTVSIACRRGGSLVAHDHAVFSTVKEIGLTSCKLVVVKIRAIIPCEVTSHKTSGVVSAHQRRGLGTLETEPANVRDGAVEVKDLLIGRAVMDDRKTGLDASIDSELSAYTRSNGASGKGRDVIRGVHVVTRLHPCC